MKGKQIIKRAVSLALALLLLAGCRGAGKSGAQGEAQGSGLSGSSAKSDGILSNVWTGTKYDLPEGWRVCTSIKPYFDEAAGVLTYAAFKSGFREDGTRETEYAVVTHTEKSYSLAPIDLPEAGDPDVRFSVEQGAFTADAFWYVKLVDRTGSPEYSLIRQDLASGEKEEMSFASFFGTAHQ